jgi:hypothetical protein
VVKHLGNSANLENKGFHVFGKAEGLVYSKTDQE